VTNKLKSKHTLQKERERFYELRDDDKLIAHMITSKKRPITLYQIPTQDRDLWFCGTIICDK